MDPLARRSFRGTIYFGTKEEPRTDTSFIGTHGLGNDLESLCLNSSRTSNHENLPSESLAMDEARREGYRPKKLLVLELLSPGVTHPDVLWIWFSHAHGRGLLYLKEMKIWIVSPYY